MPIPIPMDQKTNPMRHLDKLGIQYETHYY